MQQMQPGRPSPNQELPAQGRIVGVDYGTVRIGLAITDLHQKLASPLSVYQRRNSSLDEKYFRQLVAIEQVCGFLVGLPVHLSGDPSAKSAEAIAFGNWLAQVTGVTVSWFDERFTTAFAREVLNQSHLSGQKRKQLLDKLAAQILLNAYLESRQTAPGGEHQ
jgi:putative Holliday junction resolvase